MDSLIFILLLLVCKCTAGQPNIMFIMPDDLGWSDVGFLNPNVLTPNIDKLAQEGVILSQSYAHPMCTASRSALLSGRYAFNLGMQHYVLYRMEKKCLDLSLSLLPEELKKLGYSTHMAGKWHVGHCNKECTPTSRGFDTAIGFYIGEMDHYTKLENEDWRDMKIVGIDYHDNDRGSNATWGIHSTDLYTDYVVDKILSHDQESPMFIWLGYQAPHTPLQELDEYRRLYPTINDKARQTYLGMVSHIDAGVGKVMDALQEAGMEDNTLVVFMSDNGAEISKVGHGGYNYPLRGGKGSVWEGGTRVPTVVWGPMLYDSNITHTGLFHITDWYPTLIKMAGGEVVSNELHDGVDNTDMFMEGAKSKRREMVYNVNKSLNPYELAIRNEEFKLIVGETGKTNRYEAPPELENISLSSLPEALTDGSSYSHIFPDNWERLLFRIQDDPEEATNVIKDYPDVAEELEGRLKEYCDKHRPYHLGEQTYDASPDLHEGFWTHGWCNIEEII